MDNLGNYPNSLPIEAKEKIIQVQDPLEITQTDEELVRIVNNYDVKSKAYFAKIRLKDRQNRNFSFLFSRESNSVDNLLNKKSIFSDNVLYEIETTLAPMATSKDPDILVYPSQEDPENVKTAKDLTLALQHSINTRELKEVKKLAFKHVPVYFIGAIKYRWNPEKGKNGDIEFLVVNPQNLVLDNNAKGKDVNKMDFIIEYQEVSIQDLIMRFPDKEDELLTQLLSERKIDSKTNTTALATKIKISEVHFKSYEKKGDKFTKIVGVMWKYHDIVFDKMKSPNWDWEGETNYFSYDDKIAPQEMMNSLREGKQIEGFNKQQVFYNYFEEPEFPYIFIGYDDWGTMVYDETSRIEQLVKLQESVDTRSNQIKKMLNRAMGKHIFSTEANLKADDLEEMNWEDMDQAIIVDGDVNATHGMAQAEQPSAQIINDYGSTRQIMMQKAHVNALTGVLQSRTATSNQIAREANLTYVSDLVDQTINRASELMARAILQMIKLRYTEDHFVRLIGQEGKVLFQRLNRDMIKDGMEVVITASGVDKLQAQNRAMDMAKLQLIDPLSFFEDIGAKNAPERTKRLLTFLTNPAQYESEYVNGTGGTPEEMGNSLNGQPADQGGQEALLAIQQLQQGQAPQVPQQVTPQYAGAIAQFLQSPEFAQLSPEVQQQAMQFAKAVQQGLQTTETQQGHLAFGKTKGGAPNPVINAQNPNPVNTSQVPINPPTDIPAGSARK